MHIGLQRAAALQKSWLEISESSFEFLTFKDLNAGDKFIVFPLPGDNDGHGGFKAIHIIFCKLNNKKSSENAMALSSGRLRTFHRLDSVLQVR